ncbi:MAG TPA: restriction endonuclease subunit S [Cellvibrio sp.]|nr:restriction endonuclease subunit S [Cellvibrio sp.]
MSDSSLEWEAFLNIDLRGWETKKLGALFSQRKEKGHVNLPLLAITGEGGIVPRDSLERRDTSNSDKSKYLLIRKNDIAYNTMRMWQGVSGLSAYDGIASPAYTVCVANAGVSPNYAAHLFKFPQLIQVFHRNSQGMVDDTLNLKFENFSPIKVKIPLLPEQQKIAAILTSVDDVIESTQAQINKLKDLKTGMMQELLTKGIGHSAFKDSPVGTIPKAWEIFKIKDICLSIVDCVNKTAPVVDYPTPYKMIRTTNVRKGRVDTENVRYATQETFEQWTRRTPPQSGDLIFTREAPVGEVGILKKSDGVFLGQRTMLYRANEEKTNNVCKRP